VLIEVQGSTEARVVGEDRDDPHEKERVGETDLGPGQDSVNLALVLQEHREDDPGEGVRGAEEGMA